MNEIKLDIANINVGDKIAEKKYSYYGWGIVLCHYYDYATVKRITPKRTKIYSNNGEVDIYNLYQVNKFTDAQNIKCKLVVSVYNKLKAVAKINADNITKLEATDMFEIDSQLTNILNKLGIKDGNN